MNLKLAAELDGSNDIRVHGLIGIDFIQFIKPMKVVDCMNGVAYEVAQGLIPFGNVDHFLHKSQIKPVIYPPKSHNYNTIMNKYSTCPTTLVNFVMNPKHSYYDPLSEVFDESNVERNIDKMFSCESLGIAEEKDSTSDYDKIKIREFEESIEFRDNAYHVKLPWHEDKIETVPSNHSVALKVLDKVTKKLSQENLLVEYHKVFKQQEQEGIIERIEVKPEEFDKYIWIPHRPVIKQEQQVTTKIRPVFNCSLKTQGKCSLNEAAYPGINLMKDMLELLLKFRSNKHVIIADIRKAFLMIKLSEIKDRNRFCFFMKEGDKLICYRYTTIIFGYNASPFILNFVIKHHASKFQNDKCTEMLQNNFYVDNLIKTGNSVGELSNLYRESVQRMEKGNFDLRSWNTNNETLKEEMIKDEKFVEHGCVLEKVLGYRYNTPNDTIQIAKPLINLDAKTKRDILAQVSKVFDPLSLSLPVTVKGKMILRKLWNKEYKWDETIDSELQTEWTALANNISQLGDLQFPRSAINEDSPSELYLFCDASKEAYGFVAYNVQDSKSCIAFAKAKVAPKKSKSLPTLELLSAFLGIKCLDNILNAYSNSQITQIVIAVDAQIVLSWLLSDEVKTKNMFVRNRLKDIKVMLKELSERYSIPINFKYIPTQQNPADMITRGLTMDKFKQNLAFWISGPEFLCKNPIVWPMSDLNCLSSRSKNIVMHSTISSNTVKVEPIVPFDAYSNLNKLIGVTSKVFQIKNNWFKRMAKNGLWDGILKDPNKSARQHLLKIMQQQSFVEELAYLQHSQCHKVPDLVNDLQLFLDEEGLIRTRGRIGKTTNYEYEVINPIMLAKDHPLTALIIKDSHDRCKHLGIQSTVNKIRLSGFWISKARQAVKTVLGKCMICKKFNSLSFKYPRVTNLPKHRVNLIKPYLHTGIDYTGHVWVKTDSGVQKMYILVFTCLNIRSIHIELISDMSTHSFILAFIRFTNLYGIPSHIYSDNARSFIAGCDLLEEVFTSSEYSEKFLVYNIKHIKIPLYSAWVGSVWERMIRTIKSCLYKVIGRSKVNYFDLITILSDIQNAINARPLTYRCSSDSDLEIITPNHFIRPSANAGLLLKQDEENIWEKDPPSRKDLVKSIQTRDDMIHKFKELWYESYLLSLREQSKYLHEINYINKIKVDDIVLIKNPARPRPYWLLGRVLELYHGDDNKIRSVKVKKADGVIQLHSIKHLYPLELSITHAHNPHKPVEDAEIDTYDFEGFDSPGDINNQMSHTDGKSDSYDFEGFDSPGDIDNQMSHTDGKSDSYDFEGFDSPGDTNEKMSHTDGKPNLENELSHTGPRPETQSNSQVVASGAQRPKRMAALRGSQRSQDEPFIY